MTSTGTRPALSLSGLTLDGGWTVVELMHRPPTATGGHFSVGYRVRHQDGREAYLKHSTSLVPCKHPIGHAVLKR